MARTPVKKSALTPDDLDDFERAAMEGDGLPSLAPPYDPDAEQRTHVRKMRGSSGGRTNNGAPAPSRRGNATRELGDELFRVDRFRLRVIKKHLAWVRKRAFKAGIDIDEVNLWQL